MNHEYWMAQAIQQARKGLYSTHPNPRVGCVIVRNSKVIATGYHAYSGGPHAEVNALADLAGLALEATVYVTLEPCSHTGKTPPCVEALIRAKPKTVVIAMQDPNPQVSGKGIAMLRDSGIEVICDVLKLQAEQLNPGFIKRMTRSLPYVSIKMAMSVDGRIALSNGVSQWVTGPQARNDVQFLRASASAILSTSSTVIADDASLNVRLKPTQLNQALPVRQPVRVILDSQLKMSGKEKLFSIPEDIWIFTSRTDYEAKKKFNHSNTTIFVVNSDDQGHLDLSEVMTKLCEMEINEVHTECGSKLSGALLEQELVDQLIIYMAPCLLGNTAKGLFELDEYSIMSDRKNLSIEDIRCIGSDIKLTAKLES